MGLAACERGERMTIPKFRVYDKVERMMITTSDYEDLSDLFCILKNDADTGYISELMQSTGLFDVNGMEIFEGDIVKLCFEEDGLFEICLDTVGGFYTKSVLTGKIQFLEVSDFDELETAKEVFNEYVEVVGNIYENPELVEEE